MRLSHAFYRRHPTQLVLALVGVAAGIAVVTGVALLRGALSESLDAVSAELVDERALIVRHASGRLPLARYRDLALAPGAPDWVPVIRLPARLDDQALELVGIDPFAAVARLSTGDGLGLSAALNPDEGGPPSALTSRATLALLGRAPGEVVEIAHAGTTFRARLEAVSGTRAGLDRRVVMDIAALQAATGVGGWVSELIAPPGAGDWIRARLADDLELTDSATRRHAARELTAGMRANLTAMSLLALATGLFVVYSVLSFLMVQRRADFALLRALGMPPARLARTLLGEVLGIAAFGGLLGLVAGTALSEQLLALVAVPVSEVYGRLPAAATRPGIGLYAGLWLAGLAAALAVAAPVLRDALATPPGRQLRTPPRRPWPPGRRLAVATVPALAGAAWILFDTGLLAALGGLFLVLAGIIVLVPAAGFATIACLARLAPGRGPGRAVQLLESARVRLSPALAALSLALALAVGMGMMILSFRGAVDAWVDRLLRADLYVSVAGRALAPDEVQRIAAAAGVRAVSSVRRARTVDDLRVVAYRLPAEAWSGFEWLATDRADVRDAFERGQVLLVTEALARREGLDPGAELRLVTPDGALELPVAAVFRDYSSEQGFVAIDHRRYRALFDDDRVDSLGLYLDPGVTAGSLASALQGLFDDDRVETVTPAAIRRESLAVFDRTFRISWALAGLVGLIALVALTSALLAHGLERSREHATLRALGLTPNRLTGLIVVQSTTLTAAAVMLAVPLAVLIHYALALLVQPRAFGWSLPVTLPPAGPLLLVVPTALLLGAATGLYPAWRIRRRPVIEHLRAGR